MLKSMVVVESGEPVVSTETLAEGFDLPHRNILNLIAKYEVNFLRAGTLAVQLRKSGGRAVRFFMLNEKQSAFLGTLLKNNEVSVSFKEKLVDEFFRIRGLLAQVISQKQNAEWLESRKKGIVARKEETDVIKAFVDYATAQGSESAKFYYANISKMQNQALFLLEQKYPNLRDILSATQLAVISTADQIVSRWLRIGMDRQMPYKEIYKLCKEKVESFAETIGKTAVPVPQMAWKPQQQMIEVGA